MRILTGFLIISACFAQTQVGPRIWPTATFASPPTVATGTVLIFTDASSVGVCAGTGTALATCRWSGSAWQAVGGGSGSGSAVGAANHVQTTDGAGNLADGGCTMTGAVLTCSPAGGAAGGHAMPQGTSNTPPANSVMIQAPTSIPTAFDITLWSAPTAGFVVASGANPSVLLPRAIANADLPTAALNGVLKYTSGTPTAIGTSATNCVHEDGSSGACGSTPTNPFDAGTVVYTPIPCTHLSVGYATVAGLGAVTSAETTILGGTTPLSGNLRYTGVLLSETTQFAGSGAFAGLTVSLGRPGSTTHAEMTNGAVMSLEVSSGDASYVSNRPAPPIISTTYSLVLNFSVTGGTLSLATGGSLTVEVCAFAAR